MTTTLLPTRNEAWGFFGTMQTACSDPMQAWNAASAMIAAETDAAPEGVRDFLDSRHGRHFADDVMSELAKAGSGKLEEAIEAAIARWQGWRIDRRTSRAEGMRGRGSKPRSCSGSGERTRRPSFGGVDRDGKDVALIVDPTHRTNAVAGGGWGPLVVQGLKG